jgi:hypothetical protein
MAKYQLRIGELKIGSIVKCKVSNDAGVYRVIALDGQNLKVMLDGVRFKTWYTLDKIRPIKLSAEIIEYCEGFKFHHNDCGDGIIFIKNICWNPPFVWGLYPKELGSGETIKDSIELRYLHQLQNIVESNTPNILIFNKP